MGTPPFSGLISAAGAGNGCTLQITAPDTEAIVVISGGYTGLTLFIDASRDLVPQSVFFPVLAVRMSDLATQVFAQPGVPPAGVPITPDGSTIGYRVPTLEGCTCLRVWAYALTSGPVAVQIASGSFFANSPVTTPIGAGLMQILFALEQLRLAMYWIKEPAGTHEPSLQGGSLWSFLGYPSQSPP